MRDDHHRTAAMAPWLAALDELEGWCASLPPDAQQGWPPPDMDAKLQRLRRMLQALARGEAAVPAELPWVALNPGASLSGCWGNEGRITSEELRQRRSDLLRLALWRLLRALQAATVGTSKLSGLQVWLGQLDVGVPPGLGPTLDYARSNEATTFFNQQLRDALRQLADKYDREGTSFGVLANTTAYEHSGVAVHAWSQAWSAAVSGVFLNWLQQRSDDSIEAAQQLAWCYGISQRGWRAPSGLAVLPTRETDMHIDLWVDVVLAQALEHRAERWDAHAAGQRWHRVRVNMHDRGERERGSKSQGETQFIDRGLEIDMLYQAVFISRATAALAMQPTETQPPAAQRLRVDVPGPGGGQRGNFEIVVRWVEWRDDADSQPGRRDTRLAQTLPEQEQAPVPGPALKSTQQAAFDNWHRRRAGSAARRIDTAALHWHAGQDDQAFVRSDNSLLLPLGRAALWPALGTDVHWFDLALRVRLHGRWHDLPLLLSDAACDGQPCTWLLVGAWPDDLPASVLPALRRAMASRDGVCWAVQPAGIGAFVMAGVDLDQGPHSSHR
jgi:hypothetical protein